MAKGYGGRSALKAQVGKRPQVSRYVAVTGETSFALKTLPNEARTLLERIVPVFDETRTLPPSDDRWLWLLEHLPDDILVNIPELKKVKSKQAGHVVVMLAVYARCLLYPTSEEGLRCEMTDEEIHRASNHIIIFYMPFERLRREGYVTGQLPADPFAEWDTVSLTYTEKGLNAGTDVMDIFMPPADAKAGEPVVIPFSRWADIE